MGCNRRSDGVDGHGYELHIPPSATTTRLDVVRSMNPPYHYDTHSIRKISVVYRIVRQASRYNLRSERTLIAMTELCPVPCRKYVTAPRDGSVTMHLSIDSNLLDARSLAQFYKMIDGLLATTVGKGMVDNGVLLRDDANSGDYVI